MRLSNRFLKSKDIIEMIGGLGSPELITHILLEMENAEPRVSPDEDDGDLDRAYFNRRMALVKRADSQILSHGRVQ